MLCLDRLSSRWHRFAGRHGKGLVFARLLIFGMTGFLFAQAVRLAAQPVPLTQPQLDQLVQRIALYPDPLLAQVLTASTYWDQIPEAAAWANQHSYLKGDALAAAVQADRLQWDPSILGLLPFSSVLDMMARDPAWTEQLGNAVLNQRQELMDAVQRQRRLARQYGYLAPNGYVNVVDSGGYIEVLPWDPALIYVPWYDPYVVFAPPRPALWWRVRFALVPPSPSGRPSGPWGWWVGSGFVWPAHTILIDHHPWVRSFEILHKPIRPLELLAKVRGLACSFSAEGART